MIADGKELIALISEIRSQYNCFDNADQKYYEALSLVLRILRHLPSEQPCDDAVSRADVLETYADLYDVFEDSRAICKELHKVYDRINALPAVQPQPEEDCDTCKHGYFGDRQCDNCRVRYPSHYEREEEHHGSD